MTNFVGNNVSSGSVIFAADHNELVNRIGAVLNGGLDSNNISSLNGSKLNSGTLPATALDAAGLSGWLTPSVTFTYSANNGAKEFVLTPSADPTGFLSPGMRFRVARHTAPPTQSMAFASASSQYATKASPSGITFTGAFTCEAWVYLNSYGAAGIISRSDNVTGGFLLQLNANGQIQASYGASSNFTQWQSYQSLPLNRLVHIAIAVSSVASKTLGGIYINGVSVPNTQTLSAATTLAQTSNLSVGAIGAGVASTFFNGFIAEARVWSAAQSQASIQANMAINLTGSETNLVALFQGNGNFNDATSNANNLTATNGAVATQASNPYHATEYGIVTKVASNAVTVFCGTDYMMPNMTLDSPAYSTQKAPYGFPTARGKWITDAIFRGTVPSSGSNAKASWYKLTGSDFAIPTGDFDIEWSGLAISLNASAGNGTFKMQQDTVTPTYDRVNCAVHETKLTTDANFPAYIRSQKEPVSNTALTTYFIYGNTLSCGGATSTLSFDSTPVVFKAESAYV